MYCHVMSCLALTGIVMSCIRHSPFAKSTVRYIFTFFLDPTKKDLLYVSLFMMKLMMLCCEDREHRPQMPWVRIMPYLEDLIGLQERSKKKGRNDRVSHFVEF